MKTCVVCCLTAKPLYLQLDSAMAAVPSSGKKKAKKRSKSSSTKAMRGDAGREQKQKASGAQNQGKQSGKEGSKSKRRHRKKLCTTDSGVTEAENTQLENPPGLEAQDNMEEIEHSSTVHADINVQQQARSTTGRRSARLEERRAEIERKRKEKQQLEAQKRQEEEERRLLLERLNAEGTRVQESTPVVDTSEVDEDDIPRAHDHRVTPIPSSSQQELPSEQHKQVPVCRREETKRSRSPCSSARGVEAQQLRPKASDEKDSSIYKRYYLFASHSDTYIHVGLHSLIYAIKHYLNFRLWVTVCHMYM